MTPRARRTVGVIAALVILLFVGRWTAAFVTEHWWAATISPTAAAFVSSWALLGWGLDLLAIVVASIWFVIQALLVARTIASVQVTHGVGDIQMRETVPTRVLLLGAIASGVLLGLVAGAGADVWREPMLLAWQGVHYGVVDPVLHQDLGVYAAQLPAWELLYHFALLLAFLGLAFCLIMYGAIGAIRRTGNSIYLHPDARRHLALLLAFGGTVIAAGYWLAPYRIASDALIPLSEASAVTRIHAAQVMAGLALAAAVLSLWWALRGRHTVLIASWSLVVLGAFVASFVVPALTENVNAAPARLAAARHFDAIAWGIHEVASGPSGDTIPRITALWDSEEMFAAVEASGDQPLTSSRSSAVEGARTVPFWLVAMAPAGDPSRLSVVAIRDDTTLADGTPSLALTSTSPGYGTAVAVGEVARVQPLAPSWRSTPGGVDASAPLRRLLIAWARQAPGLLSTAVGRSVDWHLDPSERAASLLPMLHWSAPVLVVADRQLQWLVQGSLTRDRFPLASRVAWRGQEVAGMVPAVVGLISPESGTVRFFADPAIDSLGAAWVRIIGPLVAPATELDPAVRAAIPYDQEWFAAQMRVFRQAAWNEGRSDDSTIAVPVPVWGQDALPAWQGTLAQSGGVNLETVVTGFRRGGVPEMLIMHQDDRTIATNLPYLRQVWQRAPTLAHLRDSINAGAGTPRFGPVRWFPTANGSEAWQPLYSVPRRHPPAMVWLSTVIGDRAGGARTPAQAWASVSAGAARSESTGPGDAVTLQLAREWMQRADSAFRRGDLTAFGRAFEALRSVLQRN